MPRFTLIKHAVDEKDATLTLEFSSETVSELEGKMAEFVEAAGFIPNYDLDKAIQAIHQDDFMWNDWEDTEDCGTADNVVEFLKK